ncbi:cerberus [Ambystoma mexicanum]|uniref:cerberus n=1 Tax=Ambystoma mexicanum TaxID=8296 RepID=UPI0037E9C571
MMRLLLLQLLVLSCVAASRDVRDKRRRKARLLSFKDQVRLGKESQSIEKLGVESDALKNMLEQDGPGLAAAPELYEPLHPPGERKTSRLSLPPIELHLQGSLGNWGQPDTDSLPPEPLTGFPPALPDDKRNTEPTDRKHAKKFWNQFLLRRNAAAEDLVLPAKAEVQQENCRTLPFSQSIVHEHCEKAVVENNLCFGKCSSFHVPGPADHLYTFCSHCVPTKFTMHRLEMNCTGATTLVKVVMVVEECQCEVQRGKHTQPALFQAHMDSDVSDRK